MRISIVVILLATFPLFSSEYRFYWLCGGSINNIRLRSCEGKTVCEMKRGDADTLEVQFTAPFNATLLTTDVTARVLFVNLPWIGLHRDACVGHNLQCPIVEGRTYRYTYKVEVSPFYPRISTRVHWKLLSETRREVFCFEMPFRIL